ncbi:MAG: hypothetical protein GY778_12360 [bacterium]|nr:hypothetical protein [bacterium]
MITIPWAIRAAAIGLLMAGGIGDQPGPESGFRLFVLKAGPQGPVIETVSLPEGQTVVLPGDAEGGVIDVILPVGPGGSGSLAQPAPGRMFIARRRAGEVEITQRGADGSEYKRPPRPITDLARYDVRVSVISADGSGRAFLITQNARVESDNAGPVVDLFASKVPVKPGDYVLFTDTYLHESGPAVYGQAPLVYDRHLFATVTLPDGRQGDLIVDIGGAETVLAKSFLPDGAEIVASKMVEYSSAGKRVMKYAPGGATGQVQTVLGHATLPGLKIGDLVVPDLSVAVLERMPDFFGRPVVGILGMDVLSRCEVLSIEYPPATGGTGRLVLGRAAEREANAAVELPYAICSTHLVTRGTLNDVDTFFVLDTGAPGPFLDTATARAAGVTPDQKHATTARGLDEGGVSAAPATVDRLGLGPRTFQNVGVTVGALSAFATMRGRGQNVALLGNSIFAHFGRLEIDFNARVIRLIE